MQTTLEARAHLRRARGADAGQPGVRPHVPGRSAARASRCTRSTAARTCSRPTRRGSWASWRCGTLRELRAGRRGRWPTALGLPRRGASPQRVYERVRGEARSASRSRTSASTSRTATATAPTPRRTATPSPPPREVARGLARRARCRRSSASASSRFTEELRRAALRTLDLFLDHAARARRAAAARQLRGHAAEDHRRPSR